MLNRSVLFALAFGLCTAAGCGPPKLNEERSVTVVPGTPRLVELPAVSQAQKVTVVFSSTKGPVKIYFAKDFSADNATDANEGIPPKEKLLETKEGESGSFTVDVPANTPTSVVIHAPKVKTDVKVKLTNSK